MVDITDPEGAQWSVRRLRWYDVSSLFNAGGDAGTSDLVLLFIFLSIVLWPFWFVAHWLGLRWTILIERDGIHVDHEKVRGWDKSQRRIREIAESAATGTLLEAT